MDARGFALLEDLGAQLVALEGLALDGLGLVLLFLSVLRAQVLKSRFVFFDVGPGDGVPLGKFGLGQWLQEAGLARLVTLGEIHFCAWCNFL